MDNLLISTTVNKTYIELAKNWAANLAKFNIYNITFFCLDKISFNELKECGSCVLASSSPITAKTRSEWIEAEKYFKYKMPFDYAKKYRYNIFFSDVDVVFLKNPLPLFITDSYDIVVTNDKRYDPFHLKRKKDTIITIESNNPRNWGITDQKKFGKLNGSVCYFNTSQKLIDCFGSFFNEDKLKTYPKGIEEGAAQTIFNEFAKEFNENVTIKVLSVFDFANGSLLGVDYLKKKVIENAYGIHYNFCNNLDPEKACLEKIEKMKNDGYWYI